MTPEHFDLIVIGSGPAGEKGAAKAAYFGKRVAVIEREPFLGGAAANTGTLPSKTLRETAVFLSGFRQRDLTGLHVHLKKTVQVPDFLARERFIKDQERARIRENLVRHRVALYKGTASFIDPHTIAVKPDRCPELHLRGDVFLIATGSYPYRPPVFPFHNPRIYDSDTILTLQHIPNSLLVVGGGVIGCEYAGIFAALGVEVTVVEKRGGIAGGMDSEISDNLRQQMEDAGVQFFLNDSVETVRDHNDKVEVRLHSGPTLTFDGVLVSSGRSGQTASLALDKVGIHVNKRGQIPVNEFFQTNVPHVYAAGDVIGNPALASTAMEQGRQAVAHAFGLDYHTGLAALLPFGLYTIPECSMAGATEDSLEENKVPYVSGKAYYRDNARGQIIGDRSGFLKLLFAEEGMKLLGVHVIGEQATEIVHVGLTALMVGANADLFINTCYNYPTLTEMYKYAAYDALGRLAARKRGAGDAPPGPEA